MKYLVVSTAVSDDILFSDGSMKKQLAGGAGIYALSGIKIWSDEVMIVTGVGEDFYSMFGDWFARNNLSVSGLTCKGEFTPRTTINYFENGEREEIPVYGSEHYKIMEPAPEEVAYHCQDAKGVYVFKNANQTFWSKMIELKKMHGFNLMWEIASDATTFDNLEAVTIIAKQVDILSINIQEAFNMFSSNLVKDVIHKLQALNIPLVFLRRGKEGAFMITKDNVYEVPSKEDTRVIDPTGGGNSSSGAVLYGFSEGKNSVMSGIMGSVSAASCITQYGPPQHIDDIVRKKACQIADDMYKKYLEAINK